MADGRKNNGGNKNAGRKSKADEDKANYIFLKALKEVYNKDVDNDAKVSFVKELLETPRGQLFIAEHVFGKPKETINNTHTLNDFNIKDLIDFDKS